MSQHRESNAVCRIMGRGKQMIDHSQCSLIIHGDTHQSMNLGVALTCLSLIGERVNTDLTCNMASFETLMLVTLASICHPRTVRKSPLVTASQMERDFPTTDDQSDLQACYMHEAINDTCEESETSQRTLRSVGQTID
jgi:hypothetical protein